MARIYTGGPGQASRVHLPSCTFFPPRIAQLKQIYCLIRGRDCLFSSETILAQKPRKNCCSALLAQLLLSGDELGPKNSKLRNHYSLWDFKNYMSHVSGSGSPRHEWDGQLLSFCPGGAAKAIAGGREYTYASHNLFSSIMAFVFLSRQVA